MIEKLEALEHDWPAPKNVYAITTTRTGGASVGVYTSFNLGDHVGDTAESVKQNRALLHDRLKLSSQPLWLKQVHGVNVVNAADVSPGVTADGAWTDRHGVVCAVLTADCLPVFLCDQKGTKVALLHAGWRGLAAGIVEAGITALELPSDQLLAHLGPGIGPDYYEVGDDVRNAFMRFDPMVSRAFRANDDGHWLANMCELARMRLRKLGVNRITGGEQCTYRESEKFFSYRREGVTGRMASLIWLKE